MINKNGDLVPVDEYIEEGYGRYEEDFFEDYEDYIDDEFYEDEDNFDFFENEEVKYG